MTLQLVPRSLDRLPQRFGRPQQCGPLTMVPLFGAEAEGEYTAPFSGLKLAGVYGYGNVELQNPAPTGVTIVPSHIGYIQDKAQNHALCSALLLGAGQKRRVEDACCVQQAQGGYLEDKEQWFFILPLALREQALALRGQENFGKLWDAISQLCSRFELSNVGHLEQILSRQRPVLNQYQSRFELLSGQTGALFFLNDRLVGLEVAPTADYFREVWVPLVCFCYGTAALELERHQLTQEPGEAEPFVARNLPDLRRELEESRRLRLDRVQQWLTQAPEETFEKEEQERYLDLRLINVRGERFIGQYVEDKGQMVYASIVGRDAYVRAAIDFDPSVN